MYHPLSLYVPPPWYLVGQLVHAGTPPFVLQLKNEKSEKITFYFSDNVLSFDL
jgi:hypothetical protein